MTITLRRHRIKFYLLLILVTLFILGIATFILLFYIYKVKHNQVTGTEHAMPFFSLVFYSLAVYSFYKYFKNAPTITVNEDAISYKGQTFNWTDIKTIELTGKKNFPYLFRYTMEATTLVFDDDKSICLFDDFYENAYELKNFINVEVLKNNIPPVSVVGKEELQYELFDIFKGNPFISYRILTISCLFIFMPFISINSGKPFHFFPDGFVLVIASILFFPHLFLMNYFMLSENYLVIKNHGFFWKNKAYKVTDILEVVFERQGKMPNGMRIITKDFKTKLYPAASLWDKKWISLQETLEAYNVKVRNECV